MNRKSEISNLKFRLARPGFLLLEAVVASMLLAVFSLVVAHLFYSSITVLHESKPVPLDRAWLSAQRALAADAWTAMGVKVEGDKSLVLNLLGQKSVRWTVSDDGKSLRRESLLDNKVVETADFKPRKSPVRFEAADGGVYARFAPVGKPDPDDKLLLCQLIILQGGSK